MLKAKHAVMASSSLQMPAVSGKLLAATAPDSGTGAAGAIVTSLACLWAWFSPPDMIGSGVGWHVCSSGLPCLWPFHHYNQRHAWELLGLPCMPAGSEPQHKLKQPAYPPAQPSAAPALEAAAQGAGYSAVRSLSPAKHKPK